MSTLLKIAKSKADPLRKLTVDRNHVVNKVEQMTVSIETGTQVKVHELFGSHAASNKTHVDDSATCSANLHRTRIVGMRLEGRANEEYIFFAVVVVSSGIGINLCCE